MNKHMCHFKFGFKEQYIITWISEQVMDNAVFEKVNVVGYTASVVWPRK